MKSRAEILARNPALRTKEADAERRARSLARDQVLQQLVQDLALARGAAHMTQEDVALRMGTTRSAISRLESGCATRPSLTTIEKYAWAVGVQVEIRLCRRRRSHRRRRPGAIDACHVRG